jgi:hypothetical protein
VRRLYNAFHGDDSLRNPTADEWAAFTASSNLRDMGTHLCALPTGEYCPKGLVGLGCTHAQPKQSAAPIFRRMLVGHERALGTARQHGEPAGQIAARQLEVSRRVATGGRTAVRCRRGHRSGGRRLLSAPQAKSDDFLPFFTATIAAAYRQPAQRARGRQPRDRHRGQPRAARGGLHQRAAAGGLRWLTTDGGIRNRLARSATGLAAHTSFLWACRPDRTNQGPILSVTSSPGRQVISRAVDRLP